MDQDPKDALEGAATGEGVLSRFSLRGAFPPKTRAQILTISRPSRDTLEVSILNPGPRHVVYPVLVLENKTGEGLQTFLLDTNAGIPGRPFPIHVLAGQPFTFTLSMASDYPRSGAYRFMSFYVEAWLWGLIKRRVWASSNWTFEHR